MTKLPNDHAILVRLGALVELESGDKEWFGVAEQAISAVYALAKFPDQLCTDIIRRKTKSVFAQGLEIPGGGSREGSAAPPETPRSAVDADGDEDMMDVDMEDAAAVAPPPLPAAAAAAGDEDEKKKGKAFALSQLLFIVGHVAVKQIVHLEIMELDFKKRKSDSEKSESPSPDVCTFGTGIGNWVLGTRCKKKSLLTAICTTTRQRRKSYAEKEGRRREGRARFDRRYFRGRFHRGYGYYPGERVTVWAKLVTVKLWPIGC